VQKYTAQSFKRAKVDMPTKLEFVSSKTIQKYPKGKLLLASQLGRSVCHPSRPFQHRIDIGLSRITHQYAVVISKNK
jgi:hypothetical protein